VQEKKHIFLKGKSLYLLDQTLLPAQEKYLVLRNYQAVAKAIKEMKVRGAPAIGVTAGYGIYLAMENYLEKFKIQNSKFKLKELKNYFKKISEEFFKTRPTAVNLKWALAEMEQVFNKTISNSQLSIINYQKLLKELKNKALAIHQDDIQRNKKMGNYGSELIKDNFTVLTYCNAGYLATGGYGTALGVIRAALEKGKKFKVIASETRPYLQGARLTAYELKKMGANFSLICDNTAGYLMSRGKIQMVVTGADRIAANGDTANKIGTYTLAVLANYNKIPFYIAAPFSTFDLNINSGKDIPIEERNSKEVTHLKNIQITPHNIKVINPAFDVTPANLIAGIITEKGIIFKPTKEKIKKMIDK